MQDEPRFHLSLTTGDLEQQRAFYVEVLGCKLARSCEAFEDYDFFGHQLTFHRAETALSLPSELFHFGALVSWDEFDRVLSRLRQAGASFVMEPKLQAEGTVDERRKFFVRDPSGYHLEFKCYRDLDRALARLPSYAR